MGQLVDVSEILSDPEFVQEVVLIKRAPTVNSYGKNELVETPVETVACVQPISGDTLQRLPEAFRVANVQSFWIRHSLVTDSRSRYPDIIQKNGVRFTIQVVFDWSDWGDGWSEGTCVQERPTL